MSTADRDSQVPWFPAVEARALDGRRLMLPGGLEGDRNLLAAAIPDPRTRASTMTVYGDVSRVSDSLGLPDREQIAVVLCDREGRVSWIHRGARTDEAAAGLRTALERS